MLHSFCNHERGNDFLMGLIDEHKLKTHPEDYYLSLSKCPFETSENV